MVSLYLSYTSDWHDQVVSAQPSTVVQLTTAANNQLFQQVQQMIVYLYEDHPTVLPAAGGIAGILTCKVSLLLAIDNYTTYSIYGDF